MQQDTHADDRKTDLLAVGLFVLALIAFAPAPLNGFVWDDDALLTNNPNIRSLAGLARCWFDPTANLDFYPMTYTSWWLEYHLWGLNAAGYHLVNMLMHACNALILFAILRLLNVRFAWFVAAVFAVHPIQVESVVWVAERKNTLSGLLYLSSAWVFLRFWLTRNAGVVSRAKPQAMAEGKGGVGGGGWAWYALALALFVLAMLAKPLVMTLAAALVIVMWWKRGGRLTRRDVALSVPFFLLALPIAKITMWVQEHHVGARGSEYTFTFVDRVLIAGRVLCFYFYKLVLPANLSFAYPRWNIDPAIGWQWLFPAAVVFSIAAAWALRKRIGVGLFAAIAFFIATLSPALGFVNVYWHRYYFVADHMQYLAMIAAALVLTHAVGAWLTAYLGDARKAFVGLLASVVLLAFIAFSNLQSMAYQNQETLWADALSKNNDAWIAHNNMGGLLSSRGDSPAAREHYLTALKIAPRAREVFKNAMGVLMNAGKFDEAAQIARWRLTILPDDPNTLALAGEALADAGRIDEANDAYKTAVERISAKLASGASMTPTDEAEWRFRLGQSLLGLGKLDEAAAALRASVKLAPNEGEPAYTLALVLLRAEKVGEAATELRRLVQLESTLPTGGNPEHLARLALVCAASHEPGVEDLPEASRTALLACSISDMRSPRWIEVLAIVTAAQGNFRSAADMLAEAERMASGAGFVALADKLAAHRATIAGGQRLWMTGVELASQ